MAQSCWSGRRAAGGFHSLGTVFGVFKEEGGFSDGPELCLAPNVLCPSALHTAACF